MATLYITEYATAGWTTSGGLQIGQEPAVTTQAIVIPGTSATFQTNTRFVRLHTDAICSVLFGPNPTATTVNPRMNANQTEYFGVVGGQKVSVAANT